MTEEQGDLFADVTRRARERAATLAAVRFLETLYLSEPYHPWSPTSEAAAESVRSAAVAIRVQVFALLRAAPEGLTDDELQLALRMRGDTERPRRRRLVLLGLVRDSGRTREARSGRQQVVWTASEPKPRGNDA